MQSVMRSWSMLKHSRGQIACAARGTSGAAGRPSDIKTARPRELSGAFLSFKRRRQYTRHEVTASRAGGLARCYAFARDSSLRSSQGIVGACTRIENATTA
jgi:hypothetical protein